MSLIPVSRAIDYVTRAHCYDAFVCEEGFCFVSEGVWTVEEATRRGIEQDDRFEQTIDVFPIVAGMVDLSALRAHMGY